MSTWFDEGLEEFMFDLSVDAKVPREEVERVYASLNHYGIIDYDIIKEFIREVYTDEDLEDNE